MQNSASGLPAAATDTRRFLHAEVKGRLKFLIKCGTVTSQSRMVTARCISCRYFLKVEARLTLRGGYIGAPRLAPHCTQTSAALHEARFDAVFKTRGAANMLHRFKTAAGCRGRRAQECFSSIKLCEIVARVKVDAPTGWVCSVRSSRMPLALATEDFSARKTNPALRRTAETLEQIGAVRQPSAGESCIERPLHAQPFSRRYGRGLNLDDFRATSRYSRCQPSRHTAMCVSLCQGRARFRPHFGERSARLLGPCLIVHREATHAVSDRARQ